MTVSTSFANCSFQSTLPGWGATFPPMWCDESTQNFNPRSPDGERPDETVNDFAWGADFNPRSPDGERRVFELYFKTLYVDFNPRSPDGERPVPFHHLIDYRVDFNPRSPDGERLTVAPFSTICAIISIHAPRMGSDVSASILFFLPYVFQSTLPGWGATR